MRKLVSLEPAYQLVSQDQLNALANELFSDCEGDPSTYLEALHSIGDIELLDILRDELKLAPSSPLSMELRKRARDICVKQARAIAPKILRM